MSRVVGAFFSCRIDGSALPSFAQQVPPRGMNQDIMGKMPERMRHFVDGETVAVW